VLVGADSISARLTRLQGTKIMTENLDTENNNTEEQQRCKFDLA
jgi:hypothetical protein